MAQRRVPDALAMRELKYGQRPAAEKDRVAADLAARGRHAEAILLFEGRADHPFLAEERRRAVQAGEAFLLLSLRRMGHPVGDDEVRACAAAAEEAGRWSEARSCYLLLRDDPALVRISPHLPACLAVQPPPPASP